jgi:hypothetical protein
MGYNYVFQIKQIARRNYAYKKMRPGIRRDSDTPLLKEDDEDIDIDEIFDNKSNKRKVAEKKEKVSLRIKMKKFIKSQPFYWTIIIGIKKVLIF